MKHELKIPTSLFPRIENGSMNFWKAENDVGFQPGDQVTLKEWDDTPINSTTNVPRGFTESKPLEFIVGYVYVLDSSRVIFSLLALPKKKK